jgi:hypothetical protein
VIGGEPIVGSGLHRLVHFGGQHNPVATSALRQPVADDLLGFAEPLLHIRRSRAAVHVGRVEEVDAGLEGFVHDREAGFLVGQFAAKDIADWFRKQCDIVREVNGLCRFYMDTCISRELEFDVEEFEASQAAPPSNGSP